jgi:CheY-like chemotaxis protein
MRPKKTILCVDDNEQSLSIRKIMLETRGYRVLSALPQQMHCDFSKPMLWISCSATW